LPKPRNASKQLFPRTGRSAHLFAALGDETRLRLVARLCARGPMSITELTAGTDVTRQAVAKHLHRMQQAGLLRVDRRGRESLWEVDPASLAEAQRALRAISEQWDAALARLKSFVEE
jgi:DNA-binding transcriptional ArsR family regulator